MKMNAMSSSGSDGILAYIVINCNGMFIKHYNPEKNCHHLVRLEITDQLIEMFDSAVKKLKKNKEEKDFSYKKFSHEKFESDDYT